MISKKQVIQNNPEFKTLINGVINQLGGTESVQDVNRSPYGIAAGFQGFFYYSDTHKFALRYRKLIVTHLEQSADELGEEVVEMVSHFGIFRNRPMDNDDRKELYRYLGGGRCEPSTITNVMAWYAAGEVCRMFEND